MKKAKPYRLEVPHFNVFALCVDCGHRWIDCIHYQDDVFSLQCPLCGRSKSFGTIVPQEFEAAQEFGKEEQVKN
jgi:hypothetical protein